MRLLTFSNSYVKGLNLDTADVDQVISPELAESVVAYLRSFPVVVRTTARREDVLSSSSSPVVPSSFRSDGEWVWNGAVEYYVENYRLSPGSEFLEYLQSIDFQRGEPSSEQIRAAAAFVLE